MRYLVRARVKNGQALPLWQAIQSRRLGAGSIAGNEYLRNMHDARLEEDGTVHWVEVCFCETPLDEERPFWEEYFDVLSIEDAHPRSNCRDLNGKEPWACSHCDCTRRMERRMKASGKSFLEALRLQAAPAPGGVAEAEKNP